MKLKLENNNLDFRGNGVAANMDAITEAIQDMFTACVAEGATLDLPTKPMPYTKVISILKEKGLIKGRTPLSTSAPPQSPEELALLAQHRQEVKIICKITKTLKLINQG